MFISKLIKIIVGIEPQKGISGIIYFFKIKYKTSDDKKKMNN